MEFFVRYVLGENVDLWEVVDYLNCFMMIFLNVVFYNDIVIFMKRICVYKGWLEFLEGFKILLFNFFVVLVYWRCVLLLMMYLKFI